VERDFQGIDIDFSNRLYYIISFNMTSFTSI